MIKSLPTSPSQDSEAAPRDERSNHEENIDNPTNPVRASEGASEQLSFGGLSELAFDEMNIVETPFALLSKKESHAVAELELSAGGHERLVSVKGHPLPTALAEQAVLGLMWLSKERTGFKTPTVRFSLRDLICHYMFPDRFATYNPGQRLLRSVEDQLNRVAFTRLVTDRWYDRETGQRVQMNASIIDYIKVIEKGGRNSPRMLELRWGEMFYRSVNAQYTKGLDPAIFFEISKPLDRRLFRWLDRQLSTKTRQKVNSIQDFAKYKLAMTGQKLNYGGRTASSYVTKLLRQSLKRLDEIGFAVRMTVDTSRSDFSLEFERLGNKGPNEVVEEDPAGELVAFFQELAHGRKTKSRKISAADRALAAEWLETYGSAKAEAIVRRCVQLQREQGGQRILTFRGLPRYESAAVADQERAESRREGQLALELEAVREEAWVAYQRALQAHADRALTDEEVERIRAEAEAVVNADPEQAKLPSVAKNGFINILVRQQKLVAVNAMPRAQFLSYQGDAERQTALISRHGFDPLA